MGRMAFPPPPPGARREPILNAPPVTIALLVLLIGVHVALRLLPDAQADWLLANLGFIPARLALAFADPQPQALAAVLATLVTHALLHVDLLHLAVNAGFLLAFGSMCERALGGRQFIVLLVLSAIGGALVQAAAAWGEQVLMIGASGAISGAMGGLARLLLADRRDPARRRFAANFLLMLVGSNLLLALVGGQLLGSGAEIAWQAHLGGLLTGFVVTMPPGRRPLAANRGR